MLGFVRKERNEQANCQLGLCRPAWHSQSFSPLSKPGLETSWYNEDRPAAHASTHTERTSRQTRTCPYGSDTHTRTHITPTCTVGSWMYTVIGTCVCTHCHRRYMLHIYTEMASLYWPSRMGTFFSLCEPFFKVVGQAGGSLCVCVFTPTERQ